MHSRKNFIKINEPFTCECCGQKVPVHLTGGCRNHCPFCLYSKHVDSEVPGDRAEACGGPMIPIFAESDPRKEVILTHQCQTCTTLSRNRIAPDDNWDKICELSRIPH